MFLFTLLSCTSIALTYLLTGLTCHTLKLPSPADINTDDLWLLCFRVRASPAVARVAGYPGKITNLKSNASLIKAIRQLLRDSELEVLDSFYWCGQMLSLMTLLQTNACLHKAWHSEMLTTHRLKGWDVRHNHIAIISSSKREKVDRIRRKIQRFHSDLMDVMFHESNSLLEVPKKNKCLQKILKL